MQEFTIKDILKATGGILVCGNENKKINSVSTDSRNLDSDTLFVPLKGERFDGHDFTDNASMYITHKEAGAIEGKTIVKVDNTLIAFGKIAKYYKEKYPLLTVGVVGSVGKTTTRDFTAAVLSQKYNTLKTDKNFNNDIGVPIMVMRLEESHEACVLEMGMSALGEIEYLADIVRPDVLVMTNIGMSHIENLGSQENIFNAKMEGTAYLTEKSTVIANGDDKFLKIVNGIYKTVFYGIQNESADIKAVDIKDKGLDGVEFSILWNGEKYPVVLTTPGVHNVYNALAAFGAGVVCGVSPELAAQGIENPQLTAMRMEIKEVGDIKIINDCYNAAPDSVRAALKVLETEKDRRRVAILGDILEMGAFAKDAHLGLGKDAMNKSDVLVCVGKNGSYIAKGAEGMNHIYTFETTEAAAEVIKTIIAPGDTILLKASRGMHFEKILDKIIN